MALNDRWILNDKIIAIISACLFLQLVISHPLWLDDFRSYPKIPFFEAIPFDFIGSFGHFFYTAILVLLILLTLIKRNFYIIFLFFALTLLFVLNDINRLQVWLYQLVAMLFVLFAGNRRNSKVAINTLQIMMICIYCWSGIQKLNIYFIEDIFPWFLEPFGLNQLVSDNIIFALFTAFLEIGIGIGLFFKSTRRTASYFAFGLHTFILIILSPLGHNWNHVVLPWNVCMMILIYFLFYKNKEVIFENAFEKIRSFLTLPVFLILFGLMPVLNFYDVWDEQLSFKMYSGVSPEGIFFFKDLQTNCISSKVKEKFVHVTPSNKMQRIILDDWIFFELKVAPYKSKKRILQVGKKLCECIEKPEFAGLELLEVERWDKKKDRFTTFSCSELLKNKK